MQLEVVETEHGRVKWRGPLLGANDLRTLQVVMAMAGSSKFGQLTLSPNPQTEEGTLLRKALQFSPPESPLVGAVVRCTWGDILRESGLDRSGNNFKTLRESLERLEAMTVRVTTSIDGVEHESPAFQFLVWRRVGDRLGIALNPTLAEAVLGGRFCRIEMAEIRALKTEAARLIHQRLCAIQNQGTTRHWKADTLAGYAWPEHATANPATRRQHLSRLAAAMDDIAAAGWTVTASRDGYTIARPKASRGEDYPSQTADYPSQSADYPSQRKSISDCK
jgi:hypothetical protein